MAISEPNKDVTPLCVGKTIEDATLALGNVDKIQCNLGELNDCFDEHNGKVDNVIKQLDSLNKTVKELENLTSYIKWLQRVEDLRYFSTALYTDFQQIALSVLNTVLLRGPVR